MGNHRSKHRERSVVIEQHSDNEPGTEDSSDGGFDAVTEVEQLRRTQSAYEPSNSRKMGLINALTVENSADLDEFLSTYHRSLLTQAWLRINSRCRDQTDVGTLIFAKLLHKNPDVCKLFHQDQNGNDNRVVAEKEPTTQSQKRSQSFRERTPSARKATIKKDRMLSQECVESAEMNTHCLYFIGFMDNILTHIHNTARIELMCLDYGAKHAPFARVGMISEHFLDFGDAFIACTREWECMRRHRETIKAWAILTDFIVERLQFGFERAVKRQRSISLGHQVHPQSLDETHSNNMSDKRSSNFQDRSSRLVRQERLRSSCTTTSSCGDNSSIQSAFALPSTSLKYSQSVRHERRTVTKAPESSDKLLSTEALQKHMRNVSWSDRQVNSGFDEVFGEQ